MGDSLDWIGDLLKRLSGAGSQNTGFAPDINQGAYQGAMQAIGQKPVAGSSSLFSQGPVAGSTANPGFLDGMMGWTGSDGVEHNGWGSAALGAGQGLLSGYLGMKQYGLAKEQLEEGKRQFNQNYNTQRKLTNTRLEDRQKARVASNPGAYQSVGDYMKKHEV